MKKVLFICGSPLGKNSTSFIHAAYLSDHLKFAYEFVSVYSKNNPALPALSMDPQKIEPELSVLVDKIDASDAVVWVMGANCYFVPAQMQYLFDKLFAQEYDFSNKISATLLTCFGVLDDYIHERIKFASEQLGFGHIGDISIEGSPQELVSKESESKCRVLAGLINRALESGYMPKSQNDLIDRKYLSPVCYGRDFLIGESTYPKNDHKTILVISGNSLDKDLAARCVYQSIQAYSQNKVELVELEKMDIKPCKFCRDCIVTIQGKCCQKDQYNDIQKRMKRADGIVYLSNCACGIVDSRFRTFIGRTGRFLNQPTLRDKYGFVVATGGGPLGPAGAKHLKYFFDIYGIYCIDALTESHLSESEFSKKLKWTTQNLDLAMQEKWKTSDRFSAIGEHLIMRDLSIKYGMLVRGNYRFFKKDKIYKYPSRIATAMAYPFFKSRALQKKTESSVVNYFLKQKLKKSKLTAFHSFE